MEIVSLKQKGRTKSRALVTLTLYVASLTAPTEMGRSHSVRPGPASRRRRRRAPGSHCAAGRGLPAMPPRPRAASFGDSPPSCRAAAGGATRRRPLTRSGRPRPCGPSSQHRTCRDRCSRGRCSARRPKRLCAQCTVTESSLTAGHRRTLQLCAWRCRHTDPASGGGAGR